LFLKRPILIAGILFFVQLCYGQEIRSVERWVDSVKTIVSKIQQLRQYDSLDLIFDSARNTKSIDAIARQKLDFLKPPSINLGQKISATNKPTINFKGGYIRYNWNYRSNVDTPFQERNLSQHFISTSLDFTVAEAIPITVSFFDRESNSKYFRDYRDFRVEFNPREFNRLQLQKLTRYSDQLVERLRNPMTKPSVDFVNNELEKIENWKNTRRTENRLIKSKTTLLNGGSLDTVRNFFDTSTVSKAKAFISLYDEIVGESKRLSLFRDSLQKEYVAAEKQVASIRKVLSGSLEGPDVKAAIQKILSRNGIKDKRLEKLYATASSIRSLAIGKTVPNYSELTVKNINVNGINFEYSRGLYFALSAGTVDFRARDFLYTKVKRKPQFIYAGRLGYGSRENSHFFLTAYKGRKQILSSIQAPSTEIYGLSFESQLVVNKNHRILGEIAQSSSPELINSSGPSQKPSFNLKDDKNRAYSIKVNSYFPQLRSRVEVFYKYRGINYQNFSSYYSNAAIHQWSIKADQYFFRRALHLSASAAKNTYENPFLLTRYNGNTVFKNLNLAFKKPKWPGLMVGYLPSSQLSEVNGQIYENFYQALNFSLNHQYKLGLAQAFSVFSYNHFYNDSRDTGFLYYNAKNYFFNQHFQFLSYTTDINIAQTRNNDYSLTVLEAGAGAKIWKHSVIGFGVKINQLNNQSLKVGFYGSEKISIPKLGELSAWIEKSYLPGWKGQLVRTGFYNVGFFRVIN